MDSAESCISFGPEADSRTTRIDFHLEDVPGDDW
jgi:hypothetical protein